MKFRRQIERGSRVWTPPSFFQSSSLVEVSVCTVRNFSLDEPPYLIIDMNSKNILTVAHFASIFERILVDYLQ